MKHLALAAALVLLSTPAHAQPYQVELDNSMQVALGAFAAASAADLATTQHCLGSGAGREGNPLFRPLQDTPVVFGLVQGAYVAGLSVMLAKMPREHPRRAMWITIALTSLELTIAARNQVISGRQ